ncbi:hypothetical protein L6V77_26165, partial [Myxococcota bacterium]|nr:hypothetical protein [Myxococcota bacterium]
MIRRVTPNGPRRCSEARCASTSIVAIRGSNTPCPGTTIGGRVYRGGAFPELWGAYIFGDNRSGRSWALREVDGRAENITLLADTDLQLTSFGVDTDETLYLTAYNARRSLFRLARPADAPPVAPLPQR